MSWKDVGAKVGKFAPTVGALLGGKGGEAIGSLVASALGVAATPDAVSSELGNRSDETVVKLRELESNKELKLQELLVAQVQAELAAATANAGEINETMRTEAMSEHWPTYTWRPAIGWAVAVAIAGSVLTVFLAYGTAVFTGHSEGLQHLPAILAAVAGIIGIASPILGIASWFRGKMQADPNIPTSNRG